MVVYLVSGLVECSRSLGFIEPPLTSAVTVLSGGGGSFVVIEPPPASGSLFLVVAVGCSRTLFASVCFFSLY